MSLNYQSLNHAAGKYLMLITQSDKGDDDVPVGATPPLGIADHLKPSCSLSFSLRPFPLSRIP